MNAKMTRERKTPHIAEIWRHPIKSHGRERVTKVSVNIDECIPGDRQWAVAHDAAKVDFSAPQWVPCGNFSRGAKAPQLQAITAQFDADLRYVTLSHPAIGTITIDPDNGAHSQVFIQWILPICPANRALPSSILRVPGRGMTDSEYPSVSLINMTTHREIAHECGQDISPLRWRGNLLIEGLDAWAEMDWVGKKIRINDAELEIIEPITRCMATMANTETGVRDVDTLGALKSGWGHQHCGVYARVIKAGDLHQGDSIEVL